MTKKGTQLKGSANTRLPNVDIDAKLRSEAGPIIAKAYALALALGLDWAIEGIDFGNRRRLVNHPKILLAQRQLEEDADEALRSVVGGFLPRLEASQEMLQWTYDKFYESKWVADYSAVLPIILPQIVETVKEGESAELAIIELVILRHLFEERHALNALAPWFIRYGKKENIVDENLLNALGHLHHAEYITRLDADELFEFLTSDQDAARSKAKNKLAMEMAGEFDED